METVCVGVDFGGTFIKFGWMDETGQMREPPDLAFPGNWILKEDGC